MRNKQTYFRNASFGALLLVILGYTVKFYPEQLQGLDSVIQSTVRGNLPAVLTQFFTTITVLGNTVPLLLLTLFGAAFCYWKKWRAESYFLVISFLAMGIFSTAFKYLYQRPRPSIEWLIDTIGYSFPSWHAGSTLMIAGVAVIICQQRIQSRLKRLSIQIFLLLLAIVIGVSRIYVGVHYPTDIIGGWLLAGTLLFIEYPIYNQCRFKWQFQQKQK